MLRWDGLELHSTIILASNVQEQMDNDRIASEQRSEGGRGRFKMLGSKTTTTTTRPGKLSRQSSKYATSQFELLNTPSPSLHSSRCKIIAGQTAEWVTDVEDEWTDCNRCVLIILLTGHLAVAMDHCKRSAAASWQLVHNEGCNQNNTLLVDEVAGRMNDFPGNESQNLNYDPSSAQLFLSFFSA